MKIEVNENSIMIDSNFVRIHKLSVMQKEVFAVVEGRRVEYYERISDALNYVSMRISGHHNAPIELVVEILSKMDLTK